MDAIQSSHENGRFMAMALAANDASLIEYVAPNGNNLKAPCGNIIVKKAQQGLSGPGENLTAFLFLKERRGSLRAHQSTRNESVCGFKHARLPNCRIAFLGVELDHTSRG